MTTHSPQETASVLTQALPYIQEFAGSIVVVKFGGNAMVDPNLFTTFAADIVLMHSVGMFDREDALSLESFEGSGADWLERYKPFIQDGATVVTSPHKMYGPDTNDLVLQLRRRGIDRVILAGMSANLCTESHLRELLEQGFDVTVVSDGTAAAITPDLGDGYAAAMTNFRFLANALVDTKGAVAAMGGATE